MIGKGRKKEKYRPDYLITIKNKPIIIVDAKHPFNDTDLTKFEYQLSSYSIEVNKKYVNENPLSYYIISNAHLTSLYKWDEQYPIIELNFANFIDGDKKFTDFQKIISEIKRFKPKTSSIEFIRLPVNELKKLFIDCHNYIWKEEKMSPTKAFYEFSKIIFIKMKEDRKIVEKIANDEKISAKDLVFSNGWIEANEGTEPNPFNNILFRKIIEDLEEEIMKKKKKRIFPPGDQLELKPSTIKEIVKKLQKYDLHSIDEDLNGRMFEAFLNATVRGKELGQFFTPRQVVKYMVKCADLKVSKDSLPYVLDGCCGSGGFLIEAMADLTEKVNDREDFTDKEKTELIKKIKNTCLFGIEANETIASVARMNMYLHGDGGSNIFSTDSLDKEILIEEGEKAEKKRDITEFKSIIKTNNKKFDVILTNPPFSMKYDNKSEKGKRILSSYEIGKFSNSIKSNILFMERYYDLLSDAGELITIIDDSLLNSQNDSKYLTYLKRKYIIKQIISLPFNTFKNAGTSTKTSILHLRKKNNEDEEQPAIFMAICNNIGHDDFGRETLERNSLIKVYEEYRMFKMVGKSVKIIINNQIESEVLTCPLQIFTTASKDLKQRLDVFYYSPVLKDMYDKIRVKIKKGEITLLDNSLFSIITPITSAEYNLIKDNKFKYVEVGNVRKDGMVEGIQEGILSELPTRARKRVKIGDVIIAKSISCIGSNTIITSSLDEQFVSTGFIVLRPANANYEHSFLLWSYLRQEYIKAQFYYKAATSVQPEISENIFRNDIEIPIRKQDKINKEIIAYAKENIKIYGEISPLSKIDAILIL